jgi:betaine-homocysteine S-methyltransferase
MTTSGLLAQLNHGPVICAEGYLFEMERRGYLQAGAYVPEAVIDHPEVVRQLHRDFVHAGSDVVEAFTYYGHREKLRLIGKEHLLEQLNRDALRLAKSIATETGTLVAGNISNTNIYAEDEGTRRQVRAMFEEQVAWAAEEGVDFIIAETIAWTGEALLALEAIKRVPAVAVVTLAMHKDGLTREGHSAAEACKRLADAGADVVGFNCTRGPATMLPLLAEVRRAVAGHVAALPVPYRTTAAEPTFQSLTDRQPHAHPADERSFPTALDPHTCTRYEIAAFTRAALDLGVRYLGVCCGAGPHHIRSMAEAAGKSPVASRYSPDMSKHYALGSHPSFKPINKDFADKL